MENKIKLKKSIIITIFTRETELSPITIRITCTLEWCALHAWRLHSKNKHWGFTEPLSVVVSSKCWTLTEFPRENVFLCLLLVRDKKIIREKENCKKKKLIQLRYYFRFRNFDRNYEWWYLNEIWNHFFVFVFWRYFVQEINFPVPGAYKACIIM